MRKFTLFLASLLVAIGAMAQKAHQRVPHTNWVVTALNEAGTSGNEGGVAFIADENPATFYHSNWSSNYSDGNGVNKGKDGIQAFMVELPSVMEDLSLITYKGRSDNNTSGWARGVRVYVYETLPTGWPEKNLNELSYTEKEALLAKENNTILGTPAFDSNSQLWANDRTFKLVEFSEHKTGKYVLFVMDSGSDLWLTCSDFQIYQYKAYNAIESIPYYIQVTNAKASGAKYVDTFTPNDDTSGPTIAISDTKVKTYFKWDNENNGWLISTNENADANFIGVSRWCAGPQLATGENWQILVNEDNTICLLQDEYDGGSTNSRCFLGGDVTTNESAVNLYTDSEKDKAISMNLIDASKIEVVVNYSFVLDDKEVKTQATQTFTGENYPEISVEFPFGVIATKPEGKIDEKDIVNENEINKTITLEKVFKYADSFDKIETWYYLQFHASQKNYLYYDGTTNILDATKTTVDANNKDAYTWGFVGNPFDGFTIVNLGAGSTKALNAAEGGATIADEAQIMKLTASTYAENGFFVQNPTGSYTERFNKQNGKVVYWSGADGGSTFMLTERDMSGATELKALLDVIKAKDYKVGTTVGYIESLDALNAAIANAETAVESKTGCNEAQAALQAAEATLVTIQPQAGKFYTIASACSGDRNNKKMYANADGYMHFQDAESLNEVFQFVPAGDNKFYLYSIQRGTYLNTKRAHGEGQHTMLATTTDDAVKVSISNLEKENIVKIVPEGGAMMHAQAVGASVVGWDNKEYDNGSAWTIDEVADITTLAHSVKVGDAGYSTLYLNYAVSIPEGVEVYGVNSINNGWVTMEAINNVIPAKTAVILKNAGDFTFNYTKETSDATSLLKGTSLNANVTPTGTAYVLSAPKNEETNELEVGLYKATLTEGAFLNNANKAYLDVTTTNPAASYSFNFDWAGTTGVEGVAAEGAQDGAIYDITGRRVKAITAPGIYIVNGKKVVK